MPLKTSSLQGLVLMFCPFTGFHYIANVTLEIYRVPLETLVQEMRKALKTLRVRFIGSLLLVQPQVADAKIWVLIRTEKGGGRNSRERTRQDSDSTA